MNISILIATYGEHSWPELARSRAYPSTESQGAFEVLLKHEDESSIAQVRNALGEEARGDWLCFLDADDELAPGYLEAMRFAYQRVSGNQGQRLLLTPSVSYVHPSGKRRLPRILRARGTLQDDNYLVVGTLLPRSLFLEVGGFGDYPHGFEDWSLWAKCWKAGAKIINVTGAVYYAWLMPDSKHRAAWKDRQWQEEMHHAVRRDIFPELYLRKQPR